MVNFPKKVKENMTERVNNTNNKITFNFEIVFVYATECIFGNLVFIGYGVIGLGGRHQ